MRRRRAIALSVLPLALAALVRAQDAPAFEISIEPPARVTLGDRAEIVVQVIDRSSAVLPFLVTPASEGPAIEIVRGRFTRADAAEGDPEDNVLRFEVPFVARSVGTSVVRVRVDGFECEGDRCRAVQVESSRAIEIRPR